MNRSYGHTLETFISNRESTIALKKKIRIIRIYFNILISRVKVVFKWLMRGFSGHLPPEQLLYLWDLILGYDSLEIVALLAVTILSFRKENLMQVNTLHNIEVSDYRLSLSSFKDT